ncbi:MAG: gamma-glutamyl-gamma-aminobutyrate hydrolase family protein [Myxococcaceae bacterium]|nr:gamma-glutamyl-gamma-aminobutyrate hydrolase family protein [Myxococcaceae bacterium]
MPLKRVLLLKPGVTSSRALLGDYEQWFEEAVAPLATMHPVELHAGERVPGLRGFDAIIMTGSPLSVTAPAPWMEAAADAMLNAAEQGVPVLGVCFGHQLLAWRLGATVRRNPRGLELGTVTVALTSEGRGDPLFDGAPEQLEVQATHFDEAARLPETVCLLATNEASAVQAFAFGARVRGVQFHPEMNAASIRFCIANEKSLDGAARARLDAGAVDSPWGARVLRNFVTRF